MIDYIVYAKLCGNDVYAWAQAEMKQSLMTQCWNESLVKKGGQADLTCAVSLFFNRSEKTKKFVAHDEEQTCNIGDTVRIMETRPISKNKCWRLVEIIERAK